MYRCPKCNSELPAGAHFCARCGFNQINANLQAANPPGTANNGTPARSGTFQKQAANPGMPTTSPPNAQANNPMYPAAQRPAPPGQAASLQAQTGPAQPPPPYPGGTLNHLHIIPQTYLLPSNNRRRQMELRRRVSR